MDPRTVYYEQVDRFLDAFADSASWRVSKDLKNNIIVLIPPEWHLHSQMDGVSIQFALNVKGQLVLSLSIENPIPLEHRVDFKRNAYTIIKDKGLLETTFKAFDASFKRRGKLLKRILPLLSNSYREMLTFVEGIRPLLPEFEPLLKAYRVDDKIADANGAPPSRHSRRESDMQIQTSGSPDEDEIAFDDGESDYEIQYTPERKIFTQKAEYSTEYLHKLCRRGKLNLQPDFQRQFVWDRNKASGFIESLLLDVPVPIIYLAEATDGTFVVIDGQQRLSSIFSFLDGSFPDGRRFRLGGLNILRDVNEKSFADIGEKYQDTLESATLSVIVLEKESDSELKFEIFKRLNTGSVKLNDQELRNCIYRGPYLELLKELSTDADYRYIMDLKGPDKRMKDVEYVLHFGAFYHQSHLKYPNRMSKFLSSEMHQYQYITEEQKQDLVATFKKAVQINKSLFGNRSFRKIRCGDADDPNSTWKNTTVVNGALYDVMMTGFLEYDKNLVYRNLDAIREAIIHLMTENQEFIDTIEKWTSDFDQIRRRFDIFHSVIGEILRSDQGHGRCFSHEFKERLFRIGNTCAICAQKIYMLEDAAVDHIEQYWLGGMTIPDNARLTHRYCNAARRRKESPDEKSIGAQSS